MIIGQYTSKLTDKDRILVPVKFRSELGEDLIVAKWYEDCLVLVSVDGWRHLLVRLTGQLGLITSPVRDIDRFILGSAFEVKLDKQGRFILHEALIAYAEIRDEVVFVGLEDRVEIWSKEKWEELQITVSQKATKAIDKLAINTND